MNRATLLSAIAASFIALSASYAADDVGTLKGFEIAFRRAHDHCDMRRLESLVCWDHATARMRRGMRETLGVGLELEIDKIVIVPLTPGMRDYKMPHNVNLKPTYAFTVWYRHEGLVGTSYLLGKKAGRFRFVISTDWRPIIRMAPVLA